MKATSFRFVQLFEPTKSTHDDPSASCPAPAGTGLRGWWRGTCRAQKLQLLTIPLWIWLIVRGR